MVSWVDNTLQIASQARWLAGPIFDKELRVTSRQRKYYLLRFVYVCLLVLVTVQFWFVVVRVGGGASGVVQISRLGEAGRTVIATIVWFQFITGQILAAVLLSDAISGEIRQRTLEGLLVTPLGALHIVLGKLLSRLLQLVLLLAISLPVLAVARVFGGVPWGYVAAGLCITLSGSVFAGSLSLLYSITERHAFHAVLVVGLWYLVVWGILSMPLMALTGTGFLGYSPVAFALSLTNPFLALLARTDVLFRGPSGANASAPLLLHCLTIVAAAALILALSVRKIRRIALVSPDGSSRETKVRDTPECGSMEGHRHTRQTIRRVKGAPIVWKELCTPLLRARRQILFNLVLWVSVGGFVFIAVHFFGPRFYGSFFIPILILQWLFIIRLGVAAAGSVTREKEARTWAILLATPLSDDEIIEGKAYAAFRRNLPLLVPLFAFYMLAALLGPTYRFDPLLFLACVAMGLASTVVFLLGLGMYLSTRQKTTAAAVVSTLGVYLAPKLFQCGVPGPLFLLSPGASGAPIPGPLTGMLVSAAASSAIYVVAGLLCLRAAQRRLRRNVF